MIYLPGKTIEDWLSEAWQGYAKERYQAELRFKEQQFASAQAHMREVSRLLLRWQETVTARVREERVGVIRERHRYDDE